MPANRLALQNKRNEILSVSAESLIKRLFLTSAAGTLTPTRGIPLFFCFAFAFAGDISRYNCRRTGQYPRQSALSGCSEVCRSEENGGRLSRGVAMPAQEITPRFCLRGGRRQDQHPGVYPRFSFPAGSGDLFVRTAQNHLNCSGRRSGTTLIRTALTVRPRRPWPRSGGADRLPR